jgi:hypothetical protein
VRSAKAKKPTFAGSVITLRARGMNLELRWLAERALADGSVIA